MIFKFLGVSSICMAMCVTAQANSIGATATSDYIFVAVAQNSDLAMQQAVSLCKHTDPEKKCDDSSTLQFGPYYPNTHIAGAVCNAGSQQAIALLVSAFDTKEVLKAQAIQSAQSRIEHKDPVCHTLPLYRPLTK